MEPINYSWSCLRENLAVLRPEIVVPETGCVVELRRLFAAYPDLQQFLIDQIRQAPGNRARAIYSARRDGWWPPETAVEDIRQAPGNRAWAIYWARTAGWWPPETAVEDIRQAPGDRPRAIYYARTAGWWPPEEP